jgi:hypothetical protein
MARYMRSDLGSGHSRLRPPAVVGEGVVYPPIYGELAPVSDRETSVRRRGTRYVLRKPRVVTAAAQFIQLPLNINLTPKDAVWRRTTQRMVQSNLRPPRVVDLRPQTRFVSVSLAYSRRGSARSRLSPPTVVFTAVELSGPRVGMTPGRPGRTRSVLRPPTVVTAAVVAQTYAGPTVRLAARVARRSVRSTWVFPVVVFREEALGWTAIQLVRAPRTRTARVLRPPVATVAAVAAVYYGPQTHLVRIRRVRTMSVVRAPRVVYLAVEINGPEVSLARTVERRGHSVLRPPTVVAQVVVQAFYTWKQPPVRTVVPHAHSVLRAPVVVGEGIVFAPISGTLFPFFRLPLPYSRLRPPAVVTQVVAERFYGPSVTLAYSVRRRGTTVLRKPTVVDVSRDQFFGPATSLAVSRRPKARYGLAAPAVVFIASPVLHPVRATLAYSVRGKPRSVLGRPRVVGAVVYFGPAVHLAYSRRGTPRSLLRKPVVIDLRPQVYYLQVTLARIKPPPTMAALRPSTVTQALPRAERDLRVTLAYSRRGRPMYRLRPPRVVDLRPQTRFVSVNLAYSRRGRARWFLRPPILRVAQVFRPVEVTLVRLDLRRRRPVTELRAPTRVFPFLARKTEVTLAYQTRGRPRSVLAPPAVIRERENQPLRVTLARITKPPTVALLRPPVVVRQQPVVSTLAVHLAYSVRG